MATTTQVTQNIGGRTTTHVISMRGITGAAFWSTVIGALAFIVAYATNDWHQSGSRHLGVWQSCTCRRVDGDSYDDAEAVQACATIGLICILIAALVMCLYMFVHTVNKNHVMIVFTLFSLLAVVFILVALILFAKQWGEEDDSLHWSFGAACVGCGCAALAAIMSIVHMCNVGMCR